MNSIVEHVLVFESILYIYSMCLMSYTVVGDCAIWHLSVSHYSCIGINDHLHDAIVTIIMIVMIVLIDLCVRRLWKCLD